VNPELDDGPKGVKADFWNRKTIQTKIVDYSIIQLYGLIIGYCA
jgi:hypothetical protein